MKPIINEIEGGYIVQFIRNYPHSLEKVWEAITSPDKLRQWFADVDMEYQLGGRMDIHFNKSAGNKKVGKIIEIKDKWIFEYLWDVEMNETVTFEVTPIEEGCRLSLTHIIHDAAQMPSIIGGWESHLDMLEASLNGTPSEFPWKKWETIRDEYSSG
ncbi:SRPBCC family protein [Thalassobacillus hwangdonensis]|uniref:SRPBCC family protein n=1 Tax=Thalassobacillus hwangdonensis TaxID=546108 RepID=A0ABW3L177_9BACI